MKKAQIENGVVVNFVEVETGREPEWALQMPAATADANIGWAWNGSTFIPPGIDTAAAAAGVAVRREALLAETVDVHASNVLRWADLHPLQQAELAAYRRALLDITKQPGYPLSVEWPVVPVI